MGSKSRVTRWGTISAAGGTARVRPLPSMATNTNTVSVTLRHSLDSGSSLHTSTIIWIELRPISQGLGIEGQLRTDSDRDQEGHAIDGHRRYAPSGDLAGHGRAGQVHLGNQPAAENIAEAVGFARQRGDLQGQVALGNGIFLFEFNHAGGPLTRDALLEWRIDRRQ